MPIKHMTLDPGPPRKTRAARSRFGFRDPARRPGLGPPALPAITRPGSKKGYGLGLGLGLGLGNISRILENVADSDFQYFQDRTD